MGSVSSNFFYNKFLKSGLIAAVLGRLSKGGFLKNDTPAVCMKFD